jgi:hypothetical protein
MTSLIESLEVKYEEPNYFLVHVLEMLIMKFILSARAIPYRLRTLLNSLRTKTFLVLAEIQLLVCTENCENLSNTKSTQMRSRKPRNTILQLNF